MQLGLVEGWPPMMADGCSNRLSVLSADSTLRCAMIVATINNNQRRTLTLTGLLGERLNAVSHSHTVTDTVAVRV